MRDVSLVDHQQNADAGDDRTADAAVPANPASAVAAALREMGYRGEGLCLGLPSDMCLAARIDAANLPRKNRRQAMIYRLEEQFPLEAERLTADFLPPSPGGSVPRGPPRSATTWFCRANHNRPGYTLPSPVSFP